jgi:hypothetical protein
MSNYIGNQPAFGEFKKLDSIVSLFNGSTTQFNLEHNSVSQPVGDSTQLIVSLNGIIQEPGTAYTLGIGGGSIVFASAPASTDTCHIVLLGGVGSTGTVSDGSITSVKLASNLRDLLEEEFTGNGSATTFTMARSVSYSNQLLVTISGVVQPTSAYSVSGTTLTISPALPNGTNIRILHIGIPGAFNSANSILPSMLSSTGGTANQVLAVNANATGIEFQTVSGGGGGGIALTDLSVSVGSTGTSTLAYNNSTGAFAYTPPDLSSYLTSVSASNLNSISIDALSDVDTTTASPSSGQVLKWDGSNWAPAADSTSSGSSGIELTDLSVSTASAGNAGLSYNNSSGLFTFTPPDLSSYLTSVSQIAVTQHQAALSITESQISDFGTYLTSVPAQSFASLTSKPTTISGYGITDAPTEFGLPADQSFTVTNNGSGAYAFAGGATGDNATLTLIRGRTYKFSVNASGHPFRINTSNTTGTSAAYVNGTAVVNNGAAVGDIYFTVPDTAPATLYYNCEYHSSMAGTINISDAMVIDKTNGNVGIGETNPGFKLDVDGHVRLQGDLQAHRFKMDNSNAGNKAAMYDAAYVIATTSTTWSDGFGPKLVWRTGDTGYDGYAAGYIGTKRNGANNTHNMVFATYNAGNAAQAMEIDNLGHVIIPNGVTLGTSAGTYTAANTLDDYEEGTWTPTVTGSSTAGTTTYSSQRGYYTKIGRVVNINCLVNWSSMTGAGFMELKGIPYPIANLSPGSQNYPVGAALPSNVNWTGGTMFVGLGMNGSSVIALYGSSDNGGATRQNCVNESANFRLTMSYMTT